MKTHKNPTLRTLSVISGASLLCASLAGHAQGTAPPGNAELIDLLRKQNATIEKLQADLARLSNEVHSQPAPSKGGASNGTSPPTGTNTGTAVISGNAKSEVASAKVEPDQGRIQALKVGRANISLAGSWLEGEVAYRAHNEFTSSSGSTINTPFPNQASYQIREYRSDVRGTRVNGTAFSDPFGDGEQLKGRLQFDFANTATGTTQNNNNWAPRLRQAWAEYDLNDSGWYWVAGQAYSLITSGGNLQAADGGPSANLGYTMLPGTENVFQQVDAILPGFIGTRQSQFRVVKRFNQTAAVGLSLESPAVAWGGTTKGLLNGGLSSAASGTGSTTSTLAGNGAPGAYSANGYVNTSGFTTWPNVVAKASYQVTPIVLVEGWGIVRGFKNVPGITGATGTGTIKTGGGGADAYFKLIPGRLDFSLSGSYGTIGGLDSGGAIPDVTTDVNGKVVAVKETAAWAGLFAYPSKDLTLLGYLGYAHGKAAGISGANSGYGNPNNLNTGCYVLNGVCAGNIKTASSAQLAAVWRIYNGSAGRVELQPQITYIQQKKFTDSAGINASASNWAYVLAARYFPF